MDDSPVIACPAPPRRLIPGSPHSDQITFTFTPLEDGQLAWTVDVATVEPERLARRFVRLMEEWGYRPRRISRIVRSATTWRRSDRRSVRDAVA